MAFNTSIYLARISLDLLSELVKLPAAMKHPPIIAGSLSVAANDEIDRRFHSITEYLDPIEATDIRIPDMDPEQWASSMMYVLTLERSIESQSDAAVLEQITTALVVEGKAMMSQRAAN